MLATGRESGLLALNLSAFALNFQYIINLALGVGRKTPKSRHIHLAWCLNIFLYTLTHEATALGKATILRWHDLASFVA